MAGSSIKKVNCCRVSPEKRRTVKEAEAAGERHSVGTGVDGATGVRVQPNFVPKTGRKIIDGPDNAAAIILDNNPLYAASGGDFASRIAIVAGVGGHKLSEADQIEELTPLHDAAGVYVVQKDDPQDFFGADAILVNPELAKLNYFEDIPEELRNDKVKSHVTTYADTVQLVARNGGINLYAGGIDTTLSSGAPNREYVGVNLIYGNHVDYEYDTDSVYSLQPMVKGNNLALALSQGLSQIDELGGILFNLQLQIMSLEFSLASHYHEVVAPPTSGFAFPNWLLLSSAAGRGPQHVFDVLGSITNTINNVIAEVNSSSIVSTGIKSRFHKLN